MDEITLGGWVEFVTWIRVMDVKTLNRYKKKWINNPILHILNDKN